MSNKSTEYALQVSWMGGGALVCFSIWLGPFEVATMPPILANEENCLRLLKSMFAAHSIPKAEQEGLRARLEKAFKEHAETQVATKSA